MIKSFKSKEAEKIYQGRHSKRVPKDIQRIAARKLEMLAAASELKSLRIPPSNRLEKLKGKRVGQYSIRVNDQWRICFIWKAGDAYEVEIVDYH
jgi:proteic killer suppression protein